jgi:hypothetical protein
MHSYKYPLVILAAIILAALPALPQASTGTVKGTVRDQSGAVVPQAAVTLTNPATNLAAKTSTNAVGFYVFPGVQPGQYRLSVEASGMQRFEGRLTAQVQQEAVVDITLQVGQTSTEVTVADVTPIVQTESPSMGHVLERHRIEQLPINGRRYFLRWLFRPRKKAMNESCSYSIFKCSADYNYQ